MADELLSADFVMLAGALFLLGAKHGLDADHLAAIDGMTRMQAARSSRLARYCGAFFSLGHGLVVLAVATLVSTIAPTWSAPGWVQAFGAWSAIAVLITLSIANLVALRRTPADQFVVLAGWRTTVFSRLFDSGRAASILGVGMLFALSIDTLAFASFIGASAMRFGGAPDAVALSGVFILGMVVVDGTHGWWLAGLVRRADRTAHTASRVLAVAIIGIGLATATLGIASQLGVSGAEFFKTNSVWVGCTVMVILFASFLLGRRWASRRSRQAALPTRQAIPRPHAGTGTVVH